MSSSLCIELHVSAYYNVRTPPPLLPLAWKRKNTFFPFKAAVLLKAHPLLCHWCCCWTPSTWVLQLSLRLFSGQYQIPSSCSVSEQIYKFILSSVNIAWCMWMYAAFSQLLTFWYEVSLEIRHCLEKVFAQKFAVFFFFASVFSTFRNPIKKKKNHFLWAFWLSFSLWGGTWHFVCDASKLSELILMFSTTAVTPPVRGQTRACHKYLSFTISLFAVKTQREIDNSIPRDSGFFLTCSPPFQLLATPVS